MPSEPPPETTPDRPAERATGAAPETTGHGATEAAAWPASEAAREKPAGSGADLDAALRLHMISGVGPRIRRRLLERFGSAAAALAAPAAQLAEVEGVGPKLVERIGAAARLDTAAEIDACRRHAIRIVLDSDPDYPRLLGEIADPPGVLFVRGSLRREDALAVAIVGTRHATPYGLRVAERLAGSLARAGVTIVSGLARGIDAAAHRGALEAGGRTLAVLASGVLNIYPPEHQQLAADVMASGALLSESPPRVEPLSGMFPQRNRLISGLALGVIVVEAGQRSGALITARHAAEQGRDVFAVPGSIESRVSQGCHRLIRDGAKLVETADDVLEELGPLVEAAPRADGTGVVRHPAELKLNDVEQKVLAAVAAEATSIDQVIATTGLPAANVLSAVSVLEMRRLVRRLSGNAVQRF